MGKKRNRPTANQTDRQPSGRKMQTHIRSEKTSSDATQDRYIRKTIRREIVQGFGALRDVESEALSRAVIGFMLRYQDNLGLMKEALSAFKGSEDPAAQQVWSYLAESPDAASLAVQIELRRIEASLRTQVADSIPLPLSIILPIADQGPNFPIITPRSMKDRLLGCLPWQAQEFDVQLPSMPTIPTTITVGVRFISGIQIGIEVELTLVSDPVPEHMAGELAEFQSLILRPNDLVLQVLQDYVQSTSSTDLFTRYERTGTVLVTAFHYGYSRTKWIKELLGGWPQLRQQYLEENQVQAVIREVTAIVARMGVVHLDWSLRTPSLEEIAGVAKRALEQKLTEGAKWLQCVSKERLDAQTHRVEVMVRGTSVGEILVRRKISFLPDRVREELIAARPFNMDLYQFMTDEESITFADRETGRAVDLKDGSGRADYRARTEALARVCRFLLDRDLLDNTQFRRTLWSYYAAKGAEQLGKNLNNARYYYLQFLRMYYQEGMREHLKALAPLEFPVLANLFLTYLNDSSRYTSIPAKPEWMPESSVQWARFPMLWRAAQLVKEDQAKFLQALFDIYMVDNDFAIDTIGELRALDSRSPFPSMRLAAQDAELLKSLVTALLSNSDAPAGKDLDFVLDILDANSVGQQAYAELQQAVSTSRRFAGIEVATITDLTKKTILSSDANTAILQAKKLVDAAVVKARLSQPLRMQAGRLSRFLNELNRQVEEAHRGYFRAAQLSVEVNTFILPQRVWSPVEFQLSNSDFGPAHNVSLRLDPSSDFEMRVPEPSLAPIYGKSDTITAIEIRPLVASAFEVRGRTTYSDQTSSGKSVPIRHVINVSNPANFRPFMSPYITGDPVRDSHMFFGRRAELTEILQTLRGHYQDRITVIHGRRRTGKTSVLFQLKEGDPQILGLDELREFLQQYVPVYITFERFGREAEVFRIYHHIYSSIVDAVRPCQVETPEYSIKAFRDLPADAILEDTLRSLRQPLGSCGKRLVLMFDEFDTLIRNKGEDEGLFGFIREIIIRYGDLLSFVFAGAEEMLGMMQSKTRRLYQMASTPIEIVNLSSEEARDLVVRPMASVNPDFEWDKPATAYVVNVTGRNPYYIQTLCDRVVNDLINGKRQRATYTDVERAILRVAEAIGDLDDTIDRLENAEEKVVLTCLAALGSPAGDRSAWQSAPAIEQHIRELSHSFPTAQIPKTLRDLSAKYILDRQATSDEEIEYRFRVPLLQVRIRNTLRVDDVLREGGYK